MQIVPPVPSRTRESGERTSGQDPEILHVVRWCDPVVDNRGFHPRSRYVETFWLPVLGPSATLLLRRLATELESAPGGVDLDTNDMARSLGLGTASGSRAPLRRALARCVRFGAARQPVAGTLAVRRRMAPVTARYVALLPASLQELHRSWPVPVPGTDYWSRPGAPGSKPSSRSQVRLLP